MQVSAKKRCEGLGRIDVRRPLERLQEVEAFPEAVALLLEKDRAWRADGGEADMSCRNLGHGDMDLGPVQAAPASAPAFDAALLTRLKQGFESG